MITKSKIKEIIKEEIQSSLNEKKQHNEWLGTALRAAATKIPALFTKQGARTAAKHIGTGVATDIALDPVTDKVWDYVSSSPDSSVPSTYKGAGHKMGDILDKITALQNQPNLRMSRRKPEGKINEGGKFRLSADADMMWHGNNIVIISGRNKIVLSRKELGNLLAGAKRHRLAASYQPKGKQIKEDFGSSARQLPAFSSKEAQAVMDKSIRQYAKILRKAQYNIIKDWMAMAKRGIIDYFDIVRGLQTGDMSRAYPFELRFLKGILDKDKIMNRFRQYFGGKKGKKRQ